MSATHSRPDGTYTALWAAWHLVPSAVGYFKGPAAVTAFWPHIICSKPVNRYLNENMWSWAVWAAFQEVFCPPGSHRDTVTELDRGGLGSRSLLISGLWPETPWQCFINSFSPEHYDVMGLENTHYNCPTTLKTQCCPFLNGQNFLTVNSLLGLQSFGI